MSFAERVYNVVSNIKEGKVMTYRQVAEKVGSPKSARAVGNVLSKNRDFKNIPCHRVVRSDGNIGGYVRGQDKKIRLLKREGIMIRGRKVVDNR